MAGDRLGLRPPQLRIHEERERSATWLELFFDLVFVAAVAQLGTRLGREVSLAGFAGFVALFVPVWWAWVGSTFYANRFDTDDVEYRVATAAEMVAVVALAVSVNGAFGATSATFALSYAAVRAILVVKYLRAHYHVPEARPLTTRYATGFGIDAGIWVLSILVPPPARFGLWAIALAVSVLTPLSAGNLHLDFAPQRDHLPERFGLFTIIVLGEAIVAIVAAVADQTWTVRSALGTAFGVVTAFGLWWIYFEHADDRAIRTAQREGKSWVYQVWIYAHLPLVVALVALGIGIEHVLTTESGTAAAAGDRWLVAGGMAAVLLALLPDHLTKMWFGDREHVTPTLTLGVGVLVLLTVAAFWTAVTPLSLMAVVAAVSVSQVTAEVLVEESSDEERSDLERQA